LTVSVTLPAFAADRVTYCMVLLLLSAGTCCMVHLQLVCGAGTQDCRSISPSDRVINSKLLLATAAVDRWGRRADGCSTTL